MGEITSAALIELALNLTNSLTNSASSQERFNQLLSTVRHIINCDAVVLLKVQGKDLKPLAQQGLTRDSMGRRFDIASHPRFEAICQSTTPVRFSADCSLPDPYDGMTLAHEGNLPVHACMGLPLLSDQQLIGVLTLDSMTPNAFSDIPERTLAIISAMSAATLNTAVLLQQLEQHSQHKQQLVEELTHEALTKDGGELIGTSEGMEKLKRDISLVAPSDFSVLIEGETGVGKELVARTLHQQSTRHQAPLVYVNCAAIPENLIESELFGHVKGAFTGADKTRAGKFSLADEGTLFLDEIGELPLAAQSKLLRALQNQEIQPVGKDTTETIDVRILAATNRNLQEEVEAGRFRADLYHRLSVYPITIPPLRERAADITLLAGYFCEQTRRKLGLQQLVLNQQAAQTLLQYQWPGNVRELEHVINRAALKAKGSSQSGIIKISHTHLEHLSTNHIALTEIALTEIALTENESPAKTAMAKTSRASQNNSASAINLKQATEQFQRALITETLEKEGGNWAATARQLQMDRANLNRMAKRLGISVVRTISHRQSND